MSLLFLEAHTSGFCLLDRESIRKEHLHFERRPWGERKSQSAPEPLAEMTISRREGNLTVLKTSSRGEDGFSKARRARPLTGEGTQAEKEVRETQRSRGRSAEDKSATHPHWGEEDNPERNKTITP